MRARVSALLVVASSVLVGCKACGAEGGGAEPSASVSAAPALAPSPSASASAAASAERPERRGMRGGGPVAVFFETARGLGLSEAQKDKLAEAQRKLRGGAVDDVASADPREEMKELRAAVVAGIKAGKIEMAKLEPHYAALEKAAKERHDREVEALAGLHALLEPAQRADLVAKVRERHERRALGRGDGGAPPFAERMAKRRLARMKRDLDLDDAQEKKVQALVARDTAARGDAAAEADKQIDALLVAFDKEAFDAKKIAAPDPKKGRAGLQAEARFFAELLPILTPPQRDKLAATMDRPRGYGRPGARPGFDRGRGAQPALLDDDDDGEP